MSDRIIELANELIEEWKESGNAIIGNVGIVSLNIYGHKDGTLSIDGPVLGDKADNVTGKLTAKVWEE